MREKNLDLMRQDIVGVLKNSSMAFVRELVGADPVAVFRWAIVRAFFRAYFAFHEAGRKHRQGRVDGNKNNIQQRYQRNHVPNENIIRFVFYLLKFRIHKTLVGYYLYEKNSQVYCYQKGGTFDTVNNYLFY